MKHKLIMTNTEIIEWVKTASQDDYYNLPFDFKDLLSPMEDPFHENGGVEYWFKLRVIFKNADLVGQPPKIGLFIPCDKDGNVLEEPKSFKEWVAVNTAALNGDFHAQEAAVIDYEASNGVCKAYQEAEERLIFKGGVSIVNQDLWETMNYKNIVFAENGNTGGKFKIYPNFKTVEDIIREINK